MLRFTGHNDIWTALRTMGAEGVEAEIAADLTLPGLFHPTTKYSAATVSDLQQVADDTKNAGQQITAFCMANRFEERPEFEIKWCGEVAHAAQSLGVTVIRIDVVPTKLHKAEFLKLAVEALRQIMAATESIGTSFAIENHGAVTNDPDFLRALFQEVGSERLGLTLDAANFYWFGHPLSKIYELCAAFAPHVFHTHCKSIHYPETEREIQRPIGWKYTECECSIGEGDLDYARIATILQKAGYRNDLCIEDEFMYFHKPSSDEVTTRITGDVQLLKQISANILAK